MDPINLDSEIEGASWEASLFLQPGKEKELESVRRAERLCQVGPGGRSECSPN